MGDVVQFRRVGVRPPRPPRETEQEAWEDGIAWVQAIADELAPDAPESLRGAVADALTHARIRREQIRTGRYEEITIREIRRRRIRPEARAA